MQKTPSQSLAISISKILLIPLIILGFFSLAPVWLDSKIHSSITEAISASKELDEVEKAKRIQVFEGLRFEDVCKSGGTDLESLRAGLEEDGDCRTFRLFRVSQVASTILVVGLIALIVTIGFYARKARQSRDSLVASYRICWKLSVAAALVKMVMQMPLMAFAIFKLTVLSADRFYPKLLLTLVFGAGFAVYSGVRALFRSVPLEFGEFNACDVSRQENPELWKSVDALSQRLGTEAPSNIIVGFTNNFYVTELCVSHSEGKTSGKVLYLSVPLMRLLAPAEVLAIIGHEMAHFLGEDTKLSREFYPYRLKALTVQNSLGAAGWSGRSSFYLLDYFAECFLRVEQAFSRERELAADKSGAEVTSTRVMAESLLRVVVFGDVIDHARGKHQLQTSSSLAANPILESRDAIMSRPNFWENLLVQKPFHPLDSHPPLAVRLESLGVAYSQSEATQVLTTNPSRTAYDTWFTGKERDIAEIENTHLAEIEVQSIRERVKIADYEAASDRVFLDLHFPAKEWKFSNLRILLSLTLTWGISALCLWGAVAVEETILRSILFTIGALFTGAGFGLYRNYWNGILRLTAGGLSFTGWKSPVSFKELKSISVQEHNSIRQLVLRFKSWRPALVRFALFPFFPRKWESVYTYYLIGGSSSALDVIMRYSQRELPEVLEGEVSEESLNSTH